MKKLALLFIAFSLTSAVCAQNAREKVAEKVKIQRIAFITQRLSLTEVEAQQFWPVFNEYTDKLQEMRKASKPEKPLDELTDAEVEKMQVAQFDRESRELDLKKAYFIKLKKIISARQIVKLYRAEKDFRNELVRQLEDMRDLKKEQKRLRRQ